MLIKDVRFIGLSWPLFQDPRGWDDVLKKDRMHGACEIEGCEGTVAVSNRSSSLPSILDTQ
jgi:hypothetical protein